MGDDEGTVPGGDPETGGVGAGSPRPDSGARPRRVRAAWVVGAAVVVAGVALGVWAFVLRDDDPAHTSGTSGAASAARTEPRPAPASTAEEPSTTVPTAGPGRYRVVSGPADVPGAPGEVALGFNNAEQVVDAGDGGTLLVLVSEGELLLVERDPEGSVSGSRTLAEGDITLPAVAKAGATVAVAWVQERRVRIVVSGDAGATFGPAKVLGAGAGPSVSVSGGRVVAVWHQGSEAAARPGGRPGPHRSAEPAADAGVWSAWYESGAWSSPARVDGSTGTPLWAAVAASGDDVIVTWRDDRDGGAYRVWVRRSTDGGRTWHGEQQVVADLSGDPDVCTADGKTVWLAHHGKGHISLLRSTDGGATFRALGEIGDGYFAHLACGADRVGVAWEATTEGHKASGKKAGWAVFGSDGAGLGHGEIDDGSTGAATVHLAGSTAELLWIVTGDDPLTGALRHAVLAP
ncbi:MAG: exo-alpha-sialidase [Acidimicrobiia bacterium]|nr:exo-alpha-sialidase [Acidimicrobiia bacterium]